MIQPTAGQKISSIECSTLPPFPPFLSLNLVYSVNHRVAVSIGWTDAGNEEEYKILRSGSPLLVIATADADVLNYVDYTVTDGIIYDYQIMASNKNGDTISNTISVVVPIARPGEFTLSGKWDINKIHLTWTEALTSVAGGTATYTVFRDNSDTFESPITICVTIDLECDDSSPNFIEIYYKAVAINNGGSTDSNIWTVRPPLPNWKEISPW